MLKKVLDLFLNTFINFSSVLKRGGNAVDSALAGLICNGVINPQSMGIGGGFLMVIYDPKHGKSFFINARETAPEKATLDMYQGDPKLSSRGPRAGAIPGEISGYWVAKRKFGNSNTTWESLFEPTIKMCRDGLPVTKTLAKHLREHQDLVWKDPGMRQIFIDPATNSTWKEGDLYKREIFANTLEKIAKNGHSEFYTGEVANEFIKDLTAAGGIMTARDLRTYRTEFNTSLTVELDGGNVLHSVPPPGSGAILGAILNIAKRFEMNATTDKGLFAHRLVESFKLAYGQRTKLGDPNDEEITELVNEVVSKLVSDSWAQEAFEKIHDNYTVTDPQYYGGDFAMGPEDHGTAHISVLGPLGDAVSVTSTVNLQ